MKHTWVLIGGLVLAASSAQAQTRFDSVALMNQCNATVKLTKLTISHDGKQSEYNPAGAPVEPGAAFRFPLEHDTLESVMVESSAHRMRCFVSRSYNEETGAVSSRFGYGLRCSRKGSPYQVYLSPGRKTGEVHLNGRPAPHGQLDCTQIAESATPNFLGCFNTRVADVGFAVDVVGVRRPHAQIWVNNATGGTSQGDFVCTRF